MITKLIVLVGIMGSMAQAAPIGPNPLAFEKADRLAKLFSSPHSLYHQGGDLSNTKAVINAFELILPFVAIFRISGLSTGWWRGGIGVSLNLSHKATATVAVHRDARRSKSLA
jgi:hypothetical protein